MTGSRRWLCVSLQIFITILAIVVATNAQNDPNLIQGLKPYGSYHGSDIDTVSIENGKVDLHIPLLSYPQRGNLQMNFTIRFGSPVLQITKFCPPPPPNLPCVYTDLLSSSGLAEGVYVTADFSAIGTTSGAVQGTSYSYPIINMPDGSSHTTGNIPGTTNYRATDASGWMFSAPTNFGNGTAIDPSGTRYSMSSGTVSSVEDTSGNKITTNYAGSTVTGWTDSLGRIVPILPSTYGGTAGNSALCPTQYLSVYVAYAWTVPSPKNGTDTYTFCYAMTPVYFYKQGPGTTTPDQGQQEVLQSIVLPNSLSWNFTYDELVDLAQITTPTGGTISYTYSTQQMCIWGGSYPEHFVSTVGSRTENANDGTGAHTWYYGLSLGQQGQVLNPLTSTVSDPAGNVDVYTMTPLGGTCRYYETQVQKYQGSSTSGTLLQTVTTNYSYTIDPYGPQTSAIVESLVNVVPTSITTAWANGQTKQVQKAYDSGFTYFDASTPGLYGKVMSESESDYGSGSAGPVLRRTVNTYQAFGNSNYLAYNILDPLASVTVYDSTANQCKGVTNTFCEYTFYGYDEATPQSSGIATQHDANPVNGSYRGNQTSEHRWINTSTVAQGTCAAVSSGSYLVSGKAFFDTGEVQQDTDPCGYASSFLYSST